MLFFSDCRTYYITVNVHFTSRAVRKGKDRAVFGGNGSAETSTPNQNIIGSKAERKGQSGVWGQRLCGNINSHL